MYLFLFLLSFICILVQLLLPIFLTDLGVTALVSLGIFAVVCIYSLTCHLSDKKLKKVKSTLVASLGLLFICISSMAVPYHLQLIDNFKVSAICYMLGVIEWVIYANCVWKAVK